MMLQEKALAILKAGKNVFLTGSAGAGKTYVLNQYIDYLKDRDVQVAVTASTGIAATHMNGMTIHAWSGIGVKESLQSKDLAAMKEKKYLKDKLQEVQVLIIDEISMLHKQQLDMVNLVLKNFKANNLPFGGVQVVFTGDFFQLPPIGKQHETSKDKFAFMSAAWLEAAPNICYISEQHRQSDSKLNDVLNTIRDGEIKKETRQILESRMHDKTSNNALCTRLFTHNVDVDRLNLEYLNSLSTKPKHFKATLKGNPTLMEILKKSVLTEEHLDLKVGARVMFIKNNYEKGYMNGTTGEVVRFSEDNYPVVKLNNGINIVAEPADWSIQDDTGKVLAGFKQVPLRLAWAITIHKSQGMTLDEAVVDLSKTFEKGQGYVALSRLRDLKSLFLEGFNEMSLQVDALALKADKRFRELSEQIDAKFSLQELEKRHDIFIEICGGTILKPGEKPSRKKSKSKKASKTPTHQITGELVARGMSLQEIAAERDFTVQTIVSHLYKLKEADPDIDLELYRPDEKLLAKVQKAMDAMRKKEGEDFNPKAMMPLYKQLRGKVSFDELRLTGLFTT
jgi:ATP-dependent exoDNAse (exonuclease V) alpha subunit